MPRGTPTPWPPGPGSPGSPSPSLTACPLLCSSGNISHCLLHTALVPSTASEIRGSEFDSGASGD